MIPFGLTPFGFNAKRLADVKQSFDDGFIGEFGQINLDPQSVAGQIIGTLSKPVADGWENLEDVYFSQYPNSASGSSLDNVVQLNGITRLPATQTQVTASCQGFEGTQITLNAQARMSNNGQTFYCNDTAVITKDNADKITVQVDSLAAQVYSIILSNQSYVYSLPTVTFSNTGNIFVTGNVIQLVINGISLSTIPFNTDSDTTLDDIAAAITAFIAGTSAIATDPDIIDITPPSGKSITIQMPIQITGGATQATSVLTYRTPASDDEITAEMTALINETATNYESIDNSDGTFTVTADVSSIPFSSSVGINLTIATVSSPVSFLCQDFGVISCPAGALNTIVTPIAGWISVTNREAGNTGRFLETDAELRLRRKKSTALLGNGTVEAIQAKLLQQVANVTSATVFENTSLTQVPFVIQFPANFNASDIITVSYDFISSFAVPFNTNQLTTMNDLTTAFEALSQVSNAVVGGAGNRTLTVNLNTIQQLILNSVKTDVSTQTAKITGGRPPKSFEAVVEGGSDNDIANKIWQTKPAGIQTYGNVNEFRGIAITDSQGESQTIYFSRPTAVYVWVKVQLSLYSEETFPTNGIQLVKEAINAYGNQLGVGVDVLRQRINAQIFIVPGIASGLVTIASTNLTTETPIYGTTDISISESEISIFDLERIFVTVV